MSVYLRTKNNKFILDAAINKESLFESYKKLRKTRGNRKMNYVDFEWKYYQYYHGNRDLSIERSPENSSQLTFSNLPIDVLEILVKPLPLSERLRLRKVSRGVRNLVDSTEGNCEQLELWFRSIAFEDYRVRYPRMRKPSCRIHLWRCDKLKKYRTNRKPREVMQTDVLAILKNPRLKIGRFKIDEYAELLKPLEFQLDVRSIEILPYEEKGIRSILEFAKPGRLEEIKMGARRLTLDQLNAIGETEQWKRAKRLSWEGVPDEFPIENMLHFKEITIGPFSFTNEDLMKVRNILLKSDRLESCRLQCWPLGTSIVKQELESFLNQDPLYDSRSRRFSIPNSSDYFQLDYGKAGYLFELTIIKIRKN